MYGQCMLSDHFNQKPSTSNNSK